jgi:nucleoside-diphosphate-sugar epimerase
MTKKFLVIGAFGQIGSELVPALAEKYGKENVVAMGHKKIQEQIPAQIEQGDVLDRNTIVNIVKKYQITHLVNLASFLSVKSEIDPQGAWQVNMVGLKNVLDIAKDFHLSVFWPSSIAVFGPTTPKVNTPQDTIIEPTTMYGITKRAGELLCQYYFKKYSVDVRSVRYPGLLDYKTPPSQGTTEYAKWIFYHAIEKGEYQCPLRADTTLPMMYMEDAIEATIKLIEAPTENITIRTSYNLAAFSFSPAQLANEIKKYLPHFNISYQIDPQIQAIADSWPQSIDDSKARQDWEHKIKYSFEKTVQILYQGIKKNLAKTND